MRIALIGYGRMGRAIETAARARGHEIPLRIDIDNAGDLNARIREQADVAIEFTGPHSAFGNVMQCLSHGMPLVCGSTGWLEGLAEAEKACRERDGSFLYASNFSVGVNILFEINRRLAELMAQRTEYAVDITEIHHTLKKDAPSGTAITLAEGILQALPRKRRWVGGESNDPTDLVIHSERTDPYPGLHRVRYHSEVDDIEIVHNAHNREGFALGAVLAAEFIKDRKGVFSMKDVLGL